MAHPQCARSFTSIEWPLDVVLKKTRRAIVGEALAQFDDGDQKGCLWHLFTNATECILFFFSGYFSSVAIVLLFQRRAVRRRLELGFLLGRSDVASDVWSVGQRLSGKINLLVGEVRQVEPLVQPIAKSASYHLDGLKYSLRSLRLILCRHLVLYPN